jgi:hypothetical protein
VTQKARRWRSLGALAAAGAFAIPFAASAQNGDEPADEDAAPPAVAHDDVVQDTWASVIIDGWAAANSGYNVQVNTTDNSVENIQDALASANGGDADSDAMPASPDSIDEIPAAIADALAGLGGDALAENEAESTIDSSGGNDLATGDATAENTESSVSIDQTQDNSSDNLAEATQASGRGARATSVVTQTASADVAVTQHAAANSGGNLQINDTTNSVVNDQISTAPANGGNATAGGGGDAVSTAGDGGVATASNRATSNVTSSGGNSMTTGAATASNGGSSVTITQSSSNSSVNTASSSSDSSGG